jgi:predicted  nucleic acid-binding Zn-ribbon protein
VTEGIQLERELNTANKRIKELEAKVDELHDLEKWLEGR